jgi:hypothetical protein
MSCLFFSKLRVETPGQERLDESDRHTCGNVVLACNMTNAGTVQHTPELWDTLLGPRTKVAFPDGWNAEPEPALLKTWDERNQSWVTAEEL